MLVREKKECLGQKAKGEQKEKRQTANSSYQEGGKLADKDNGLG